MAYTAPDAKTFAMKKGTPAEKITAELAKIDAEIELITLGEISLEDGEILVGSADDVATAVTPAGDVTISNTGATTIGAKKVTAAMVACADGKILIGGADGAAAEKTPTGDVTITNLGATAIGAKKVTAAMIACADGKILIGGADGATAEKTPSGEVTMTNAGAFSLAKHKSKFAILSGPGTNTALATTGVDLADGNITTYHGVLFAPVALTAVKLHYYLTEAFVKDSTDCVLEIYDDAETPVKRFGKTFTAGGEEVKTHGEISPETGVESIAEGTRIDMKITATGSGSGTGHAVILLEYYEA